ncbi:type I polyketide synthase [Streptomyces alanosinicus]|uniref:Type I polyketide synthase n=1 Tax=Streptomyces alanosinicus TaxID=68171 RepID=A0A919D850_9ACTN|nr:type I polyketide synthase [Streptomyces alanosinicus]GHE15618.1 hypothetical protein GCM10010339_90870 [Streptomyces alanosinicus]
MSGEAQQSTSFAADETEPIAIVGIGLRLPGGNESADDFETFLREGRSGIRPLPEDRWDAEALRPDGPDDKGKITTAGGGFLDRIDLFDAPFFNISPKEARYIDPQQRMVLETAWQALEHAGIDPTPLRHGNGGVYMGVSSFDYALHMGALPYDELDGHLAAGSPVFAVAGRVSYFLGWRGPSICVDSACSSSLSALHLAVQALRAGECSIALCGGVNALHHPSFMVMFSQGQMLAADGRCKTFDESADGYTRAEGCGILVLKRLSDARRAGDNVIALVRGTSIGQDGDSAGLTVPHGPAQEQVIRNALAAARLTPGDIQYVEAHGTGTPLGDPIELGAINGVFADSHSRQSPLLVGSVKTNIGHMEPASGIVGVIKTALQLKSGLVYPHLNLTTPTSRIPWDTYPVTVPTTCRPWPAGTRRAVVNSFGFAGTIAATVLEQAPPAADAPARQASETDSDVRVFTLSGKNAAGLRRQVDSYRTFVDAHPDLDLARLCHTANVGRAHLPQRVAGVVRSRTDLVKLLDAAADRENTAPAVRKVAFCFSGQGTQYAGMGAALYRRFAVFREHVDACDDLFAPYLAESVRALILGKATDPTLLDRTGYTQPALFTFEYALARLWMSWGIRPSVLMGHSIGEVAAAAVAGLFSLSDAVTLVAHRARLMQSVRQTGGMAAVGMPEDKVSALLADRPGLALAAVNAPDQCVVSGAADQLADLVGELRELGIQVDPLTVSHAFHSPLMAEVFDEFRAAIDTIVFRQPEIPLISNITGAPGRFPELGNPDYWVRHIGEPVLFMAGVQAVAQRGRHAFVEIGPSTALTALAKRCVPAEDHRWIASARRRDPDGDTVLRGLADLYAAGVNVSWSDVHAGHSLPRMQLPGYAFERKRYWLPEHTRTAADAAAGQGSDRHPLLGREDPAPAEQPDGTRQFTGRYTAGRPSVLNGHTTAQGQVAPSAAYVELSLALQDTVYGHTRRTLRDLRVLEPLTLPEEGTVEIRTRLLPRPEGGDRVEVASGPADQERLHATAVLADPDGTRPQDTAGAALRALADMPGEAAETVLAEDLYTDLASVGRRYSDRYRLLTRVSRHPGGVITGELANRTTGAAEHLPVEVLECATQAVAALDAHSTAVIPLGYGSVRLFQKPRGARLRMVGRVTGTGDERHADLLLLDGDAPVAELRDVRFGLPGQPEHRPRFLHRLEWLRRGAVPLAEPAARHILVLGAASTDRAATANGVRWTYLDGPGALADALADASVTDVCWCWQAGDGPMSAARLRAECERNYRDLLTVVAALTGSGAHKAARLWLVTRRAQWLPDDRPGTGEQLAAATLWGFGHTLLNEYPGHRATLVDLPADAGLDVLADEVRAQATDDYQIAYRDGRRHVRRLLPGEATPAWQGGFAVRWPESGEGHELVPVAADETAPGPGEVRLRVHGAAVHHRTTAPVPETEPAVLGSGCSGTVVEVGSGAPFAVGDRVVAHHTGSLRGSVTVAADLVATVPDTLDLAAAAALPSCYLTAHRALRQAQAAPDATVLVPVRDGVGQALLALAARQGHRVIALAVAEALPALAAPERIQVIAPHIADPARQVLRLTDGRGVDVAFDTDGTAPWTACLAAGGRHVPLGSPGRDGTAPAADGGAEADAPGERTGEILSTLAAAVVRGELPPVPVDVFRLDEAGEAVTATQATATPTPSTLAGTRQPVVVVAPSAAERSGPPTARPAPVVRPDRTYLISGGLGGLGLVTATELADRGARHLVLVSRGGKATPEAEPVLAALGERCEITVRRADLAEPADVARLFAELRGADVPLGGIVHAAGTAGKSLIGSMTWQDIDEQLAAQAYGGWLLHEASLDFPDLDLFVVHSSIAAVVGGATQAHYAAAFTFLDGLVAWRARQGLAGRAVNWGMWSRVGMSARLDEHMATELERTGMRFFSPARALRTLRRLLSAPAVQYVAGEWDWDRFVTVNPLTNALYARVVGRGGTGQGSGPEASGPALDLDALTAQPKPERLAAIGQVVLARVAAVLQAEEEEVDPATEFVALGLDSLMSVDLRVGLESDFRVPLPASLTFDHPSPQALAEHLDAQLVPDAG